MGTNYYTLKGTHIGKRSVAGPYCWDCGVTLCRDGIGGVHAHLSVWLNRCPICGNSMFVEALIDSAAGRELGFNNRRPKRKNGVRSCSSFTWAIEYNVLARTRFVKDEYGTRLTIKQFRAILDECPIQYTDMVGQEFS